MSKYLPSLDDIIKFSVLLMAVNLAAGFFPFVDKVLYYPADYVKGFLPGSK